jgi:DNA end-binding protein Ku
MKQSSVRRGLKARLAATKRNRSPQQFAPGDHMPTSVWKGHIELYRADSPVPPEEDDEDAAPAAPAAAKGPVRIDRKREPEPEPAPEPVFEPVRHISVGQSSDERAPASSITRGYEYERGKFVTLAPEELRSIAPQTSSDMQIRAFVRLSEIDPVYFEASYYVKPEEAGRKPYALLFEAMREAGFAGVGQFTMHRRERVAILRAGPAGLLAHTMYFASEVRSDYEVRADTSLVTPKDVALAKTLVTALAESFDPSKYRDTYRQRLEALITAKVEGRQTAVVSATSHSKPVADIMQALRRSLEAVRKPAAKAEATKPPVVKRAGSK